jgi:hypothetical protein
MFDLGISLNEGLVDIARIARVLADAGINIDAVPCTSFASPTTSHFLVEHDEDACAALSAAGINSVNCRPVLVYMLPNRPGTLAHYTQALLSGGVAIDFMYQATAKGMVVGAADLDGVRRAFSAASAAP